METRNKDHSNKIEALTIEFITIFDDQQEHAAFNGLNVSEII